MTLGVKNLLPAKPCSLRKASDRRAMVLCWRFLGRMPSVMMSVRGIAASESLWLGADHPHTRTVANRKDFGNSWPDTALVQKMHNHGQPHAGRLRLVCANCLGTLVFNRGTRAQRGCKPRLARHGPHRGGLRLAAGPPAPPHPGGDGRGRNVA